MAGWVGASGGCATRAASAPGVAVETAPRVAVESAPRASAASPVDPREQALAASLDRYFAERFPADEPGGAVLVLKRDRVVFSRGYGLADLQTHAPITPRTVFNLGSLSKTFVANAILQLQERGRLSVEDPLLTYFPEFLSRDIAAKVRLKHLLTHTSGLPDRREVAKHYDFYLTATDALNWLPITQTQALYFEPGSQYLYSNPAFNGLALVVERVTGMKWQTFVHDNIFVPAGMLTSTITDGPHPTTGVAHGYARVDGEWRETDYGEVPTFAAAGNGGVWSSVEDLARYELALQRGVFLRPETVAQSRTVQTFPNWASRDAPAIGWSWFLGETPEHERTIGHNGGQGGFVARYVTLPDPQILVVILCNARRDNDAYVTEVLAQLRAAAWLDAGPPADAAARPDDPSRRHRARWR